MNPDATSRGTVLVCDDSLLMRKMVIDALEADGWTIAGEATDGAEAIAQFLKLRPNLVTMDIVMPGEDGIHGLSGILAEDPRASVVMISALNQTKMVSEAIRKGAEDFIVKPFLPEQVQETAQRISRQWAVAGN
ncbi:MAG: response regulator [Pirellulaceae bacterium]